MVKMKDTQFQFLLEKGSSFMEALQCIVHGVTRYTNLDFTGVDVTSCELYGSIFDDCVFPDVEYFEATLCRFNHCQIVSSNVDFDGVTTQYSDISGHDLVGRHLIADACYIDLTGNARFVHTKIHAGRLNMSPLFLDISDTDIATQNVIGFMADDFPCFVYMDRAKREVTSVQLGCRQFDNMSDAWAHYDPATHPYPESRQMVMKFLQYAELYLREQDPKVKL